MWTIAYNNNKGTYEIHAAGCRHLTTSGTDRWGHPKLDIMGGTYPQATGAEAKADFEAGNEDCFANLAPCAR